MKVALIGADGQLGSDVQKVFLEESVVPLTISDLDITDKKKVFGVLSDIRPDVIINTAAFHQVDVCEDEPSKAFSVNCLAVGNVARASAELRSVFVHISTDYVFGADTKRNTPYTEDDKEGPLSVYGISKLAGEKMAMAYAEKFFVVRTSGLFGTAGSVSRGGNFVETMIRLGKEKKTLRVVDDQVVSPTYTLNLAQALLKLVRTQKYGLYHAVSEGECSWYEFAKEIFKLTGISVNCVPCTSEEYPTKAKRPHYSSLGNAKLKLSGISVMKPWKMNVKNYLIEKKHISI